MYIKRFVKHYYIMLVPAFLWLLFFSIVPMFGIVMAFQDYNPGQGILHSKFVGLANFEYMFQMSDIAQVLRNTVTIAVGKIIGNIIFPLIFALLLNELALKRLKRPIQTIVYLPYFLSWVILAKIVLNIFGYTGPINQLIQLFGGDPINFFGEAKLFQPPYRYAGSCDSLPAARQLRGGGIRHIQASGICVMIRKVDYLWT